MVWRHRPIEGARRAGPSSSPLSPSQVRSCSAFEASIRATFVAAITFSQDPLRLEGRCAFPQQCRSKDAAVKQWPEVGGDEWEATRDTVQMWTQVVGKVRLAVEPAINHWWQVPLYVSPED